MAEPAAQSLETADFQAMKKMNDDHVNIADSKSPPESLDEKSPPAEASALKNLIVWAAIALSSFCVFLDEGIISTAIPVITDRFDSLGDIGVHITTSSERADTNCLRSGTVVHTTSRCPLSSCSTAGCTASSPSRWFSWHHSESLNWGLLYVLRALIRSHSLSDELLQGGEHLELPVAHLCFCRQSCRPRVFLCT